MVKNAKTVIELRAVSKYFDLPQERTNSLKQLIIHPSTLLRRNTTRQVALEDISFTVEEGEFFGVVGKNGSGKSTLLKILAGIYQEDTGHAEVRGTVMPFIELGVGFNEELTGRENIFLAGALLGFSTQQMQQRYDAIVEFAELDAFMDQKLKNYSSGMQVRLAFSIATQVDTDVFLIDEVLAVGDTEFQRKCYDYFNKLKRDKKTVVFITHDMDAVRRYCDRAMLIHDSKVEHIGSVMDVTKQYDKLNQRKSLSESSPNGEAQRWGDERAKVVRASVEKDIFEDGQNVRIQTDFEVYNDIKNVVIGIGIFDQQGRPITGTNTDLLKAKLGDIESGEVKKITWEIDQVFNDGEYDVSIEIKHDDGISDSYAEAVRFAVTRSDKTGYLISPDYQIEIDGEVFGKKLRRETSAPTKDSPSKARPVTSERSVRSTPAAQRATSAGGIQISSSEPGVKNALQMLNRSMVIFLQKKQMSIQKRAFVFGPDKSPIELGGEFEQDLLAIKSYDYRQMQLKPRIHPGWYVAYQLASLSIWGTKLSFVVLKKVGRILT